MLFYIMFLILQTVGKHKIIEWLIIKILSFFHSVTAQECRFVLQITGLILWMRKKENDNV